MAWNFYPYDQKTLYLLPPSVEEWVPKKSLARFVNDVLDRLEAQGRLKSLYKSLSYKLKRTQDEQVVKV